MGKLHDYLVQNGLASCKTSAFFAEFEFKTEETHKDAAWGLFVEVGTRKPLKAMCVTRMSVESRALESLYRTVSERP